MCKIKKTLLLWSGMIVLILSSLALSQKTDDLQDILKKVEGSIYPENVVFVAEMTIHRPHKEYHKKIKVYLKGNERSLVEFLEPAQERGLKVLNIDKNMWMFLPSVDKVIRLSGKMSVTGGDFVYDDILRVKYGIDYSPASLSIEGQHYLLALKAKTNRASYKEILIRVNPESYLPISQEFYVSGDLLLKRLTYLQPKLFEGRSIPSQFLMEIANSKDFKTTLNIVDYSNTHEIPERVFTQEYLKKGL